MSDLTEFLLARIAEDAAVARVSIRAGRWTAVDGGRGGGVMESSSGLVMAECRDPSWPLHIAQHDPARVLAECEAKRRIVELATGPIFRLADRVVGEWGEYDDTDADEDLLRLLALPYADHPDYREEWRP